MRLLGGPAPLLPLALFLLTCRWLPTANAVALLESTSLNSCMDHSQFTASEFLVIFTPNNSTLYTDINGDSAISGYVKIEFQVIAYGYTAYTKVIDPCSESDLSGMCPMTVAPIDLPFNTQLPADSLKQVPNAIYYIPDLDAKVQVWINSSTTGAALACVEADLSNGKTVHQKGVEWTIAVIAILGLITAAIISGLGHSNAATHVCSNAMSLFSYFQAQALLGMTAVSTPPIVRAWTQNFQWSMGLISVGFLQKLATWYQRATGGTPSSYLSQSATTSVQVQKRSLDALSLLQPRTNTLTSSDSSVLSVLTVKGIVRAGYLSNIEKTNIFLTAYIFFIIFVLFVTIGVVVFKYACDGLARAGRIKPDRFQDFRNGWRIVLKGMLFRVVLIAFPQLVVLCLWELTERDSAAEVVLAVCTFVTAVALLAWGSIKVWRIARRSLALHRNPAYGLYSDPKTLHKWGFLYVTLQASMYFFIIPILGYILVKGAFVAFGQSSGTVQAVAFLILETAVLITISIMRPYMDKKTNAFNISIAAVNFFNVLLLLFFSGIFNIADLAIGIMGVLYFFVNAVFSLVILLMTLWATGWAIMSKNPDTRYRPMHDDRGSFIKSQTNLATAELDALGATARGDPHLAVPIGKNIDLEGDEGSYSGSSDPSSQIGAPPPIRPNLLHEKETGYGYQPTPPHSLIDPTEPILESRPRTSTDDYSSPTYQSQSPVLPSQSPVLPSQSPVLPSQSPRQDFRPGTAPNAAQAAAQHAYRQHNSGSPWQTGVGYAS